MTANDPADASRTVPDRRWNLPRYQDLPAAPGLGARHAWGVFGPDDDLGRVNLIAANTVRSCAAEVRTGEIFNLCLPLTLPDPPWSTTRQPMRHHVIVPERNTQDDYIDSFYPQYSTQWDGLRHKRARELGFWGGLSADAAGEGGDRLGIEHWAEHGMVGRGVLADVAGYLADRGEPLSARQERAIGVDLLRDVLGAEGVVLGLGDILLVRTAFVDEYLLADPETRADFSRQRDCPGLHAGEEMAEFLWDSGVAAVVADNPAVEVIPGSPAVGSLHRRLIPLLGFALGEFFRLGPLAAASAADGRYTCMFVGVPLNLPGGVGSPGNSVAIR